MHRFSHRNDAADRTASERATTDPFSADLRRRSQRLEFLESDDDGARQSGDEPGAAEPQSGVLRADPCPRAGGSEIGREVMQPRTGRRADSGLPHGHPWHTNHRSLDPQELEQSLTNGSADIAAITGAPPTLVRPPFWNYDKRTFAAYQQHGMHVLLTDLSANDGKIWGFNASPRRRAHFLRTMSEVRERIALGELPVVDGVIPVVVTFHDLNRYTARHTREYLQILLDSAQATGVKTAEKPFYDDTAALQRAAMARTVRDSSQPVKLPGLWNWIWGGDSH